MSRRPRPTRYPARGAGGPGCGRGRVAARRRGAEGGRRPSGEAGPEREAVPLLEPRDGLPPLVTTPAALDAAIRALAAGTGPVAVDAERASGFRYGHRAFLVQLRRDGAGTVLIDPVACPDLSGLDAALADTEAVLHAASQDLPCLAELGYRPRSIFDTEMAGRLLGYPAGRPGHAGRGTAGAAPGEDPLRGGLVHPAAARGVAALRRPRRRGAGRAARHPGPAAHRPGQAGVGPAGVRGRARRRAARAADRPVAAHLRHPPGPQPPRPGRRPRAVAGARQDRPAAGPVADQGAARPGHHRGRPVAPGQTPRTWPRSPASPGAGARRHMSEWLAAVGRARALPDRALPDASAPAGDGPPPAHRWADRDPEAAKRLTAVRAVVAALADSHGLPTENLLPPDAVRRLSWQPPADPAPAAVSAEPDRLRRPALAGRADGRADRQGPAADHREGRRVAADPPGPASARPAPGQRPVRRCGAACAGRTDRPSRPAAGPRTAAGGRCRDSRGRRSAAPRSRSSRPAAPAGAAGHGPAAPARRASGSVHRCVPSQPNSLIIRSRKQRRHSRSPGSVSRRDSQVTSASTLSAMLCVIGVLPGQKRADRSVLSPATDISGRAREPASLRVTDAGPECQTAGRTMDWMSDARMGLDQTPRSGRSRSAAATPAWRRCGSARRPADAPAAAEAITGRGARPAAGRVLLRPAQGVRPAAGLERLRAGPAPGAAPALRRRRVRPDGDLRDAGRPGRAWRPRRT